MEPNDLTIQKLHDAFLRFTKAEWRQKSFRGLNRSEIRVLYCLMDSAKNGSPKLKVSEISRKLMVTTPTITQLTKNLIRDNLVVRTVDPIDRRSVGIELTAKGEEIAKEADEQFNDSISGLIEYLGLEDSNLLADLLSRAYEYYANNGRL